MEPGWNLLLLASKWLFIGLIYLALLIVVLAVRREMRLRLDDSMTTSVALPGRLRAIRGGGDGQVRPGMIFALSNPAVLGADPANDLPFTDPYLSGQHTRFRWDGVQWWVEDLGSKNGTFVDGRQCPPNRPQPFPPGSKLQVGEMAFELVG